jgi:hypothetical protein
MRIPPGLIRPSGAIPSNMGLDRLEPEAAERLETSEDGPEGHYRSTTDLTLIRPTRIRPNPGNLPYFHG